MTMPIYIAAILAVEVLGIVMIAVGVAGMGFLLGIAFGRRLSR